jgi:hypothetical protein
MTIAMQTTDKTLKEVLDALIELDLIPSSRVGPIKTAVKQYALILGCSEPAQCPLSAFHLQDLHYSGARFVKSVKWTKSKEVDRSLPWNQKGTTP